MKKVWIICRVYSVSENIQEDFYEHRTRHEYLGEKFNRKELEWSDDVNCAKLFPSEIKAMEVLAAESKKLRDPSCNHNLFQIKPIFVKKEIKLS